MNNVLPSWGGGINALQTNSDFPWDILGKCISISEMYRCIKTCVSLYLIMYYIYILPFLHHKLLHKCQYDIHMWKVIIDFDHCDAELCKFMDNWDWNVACVTLGHVYFSVIHSYKKSDPCPPAIYKSRKEPIQLWRSKAAAIWWGVCAYMCISSCTAVGLSQRGSYIDFWGTRSGTDFTLVLKCIGLC